MNQVWHFYDPTTGLFTGRTFSAPESNHPMVDANTPEGHLAFNANGIHIDNTRHRLDLKTRSVVEYQPAAPSSDHEWDVETKRWVLNSGAAQVKARGEAAKSRIAHLETNVQPRALREVALNQPNALERLRVIDEEIALLRRDIIG